MAECAWGVCAFLLRWLCFPVPVCSFFEHEETEVTERAAAEQFAQATGARMAADNKALVSESDVVFLAVKPQHFAAAAEAAKGAFKADQLVVSIMAGVSTATIAQRLGSPRIVRVMPNTP